MQTTELSLEGWGGGKGRHTIHKVANIGNTSASNAEQL